MYVPARICAVLNDTPGGQNPDADLALTWSGIVFLHDPQDLMPTEVIDDDG